MTSKKQLHARWFKTLNKNLRLEARWRKSFLSQTDAEFLVFSEGQCQLSLEWQVQFFAGRNAIRFQQSAAEYLWTGYGVYGRKLFPRSRTLVCAAFGNCQSRRRILPAKTGLVALAMGIEMRLSFLVRIVVVTLIRLQRNSFAGSLERKQTSLSFRVKIKNF